MTRSHTSLIEGFDYGYGFVTYGSIFGHSGEWDGFETELMVNYKSNTQLAILTNSGHAGRTKINDIKKIVGIYD